MEISTCQTVSIAVFNKLIKIMEIILKIFQTFQDHGLKINFFIVTGVLMNVTFSSLCHRFFSYEINGQKGKDGRSHSKAKSYYANPKCKIFVVV
jgi:hypothetical protein